MSDKSTTVPIPSPPASEQHAAEVTWGDFVAALPATLAMHPERASTPPAARSSQCFVPRRAVQGNGSLPRAYMAARAGARRERSTVPRADEGSAATESPFVAMESSLEASSVPERTDLATGRWLVSGLVLVGSVIVAVLTSVLTVRAMNPTAAPTLVASARQPVVNVSAAPVVIARDTSTTVRPPHSEDSVHVLATVPSVSSPIAQTPNDTVAPPPLATRSSPKPERVAHASNRATSHVDRHPVSIAEHARTSSQSSSAIPATRMTTTKTAAPLPAANAVSAPATSPASTAPAATAPAANNSQVLEELRAIHAEIDARKKHMDSLTAALDSLKHVTKPD